MRTNLNSTQPAPALSDEQVVEMGSIPVDSLISPARLEELNQLADLGYTASAIICAIREAAYAARNNIVIPPTTRN